MITVIALVIGILILGGGLYYLMKEKQDKEAKNIYTITALAGGVIVLASAIKIIMAGF